MSVKVQKKIEKEIDKYLSDNWSKDDVKYFLKTFVYQPDLNALNENLNVPLSDFVKRGGKRLRPQLFLDCLETFGIDHKDFIDLAIVIELIHNATLILDDIEDDGLLRRGKPTIHTKYGLDTATNSGFLLHILPMKIVLERKGGLSQGKRLRIWKLYYETLTNVGFGQGVDIYWHKHINGEIAIEQYLEMARLKTGSLMRMSVGMACIIAGLKKPDERKFKSFAESLGLAFQIIDDTLDIKNSDSKFGKAYGNDITEGKISLPIVYTFQNISDKDKIKLVSILAKHTRNKKEISKALRIIKKSGAIQKSLSRANEIIDKTWVDLEKDYSEIYELGRLKKIAYRFVNREY